MERNLDAMIDRERRIEISKRNGDYYRQLSWERNCNPDTTMPNTPPNNKYKNKKEFVDDLIIKK